MISKIEKRREFLLSCATVTRTIHAPIIDLVAVKGHLNPAGLGEVLAFSGDNRGQSTVGFDTQAEFHDAEAGRNIYGGAEYAVVQSPEAEAVCKKMAALHGGAGAVILGSGLNAIVIVFQTFLKNEAASIAIPDNRYYPAERALKHLKTLNPYLHIYRYPGDADAATVGAVLDCAEGEGNPVAMLYLEAPGSQTFEIPDLDGLVALAKDRAIRTVMDNTWASHVRYKPLAHGVDIVVQATTKYEGGYADTPSGVAIAANDTDFKALSYTVRALGAGAVSPQICSRLSQRVESTEARMDQHYESALAILLWARSQLQIETVLCPFDPQSPYFARFQKYFRKGNGLMTLAFRPAVTQAEIDAFLDHLLLFRIGESWGGHVSLALVAKPARGLKTPTLPEGIMVRLSIGLEDAGDLARDLQQAAQAAFT